MKYLTTSNNFSRTKKQCHKKGTPFHFPSTPPTQYVKRSQNATQARPSSPLGVFTQHFTDQRKITNIFYKNVTRPQTKLRWLCAYMCRNVLHPWVEACGFDSACRWRTYTAANISILLCISVRLFCVCQFSVIKEIFIILFIYNTTEACQR